MEKNKMKQRLITVVVLILLSRCFPFDASAQESSAVFGYITIWEHNYSFKDSLEAVINAFQDSYPNVEVDYTIKPYGDYDDLLRLSIQAGSGPDLFWTNGTATTTMQELVDAGICYNLTDLIDYSFISDNALALGRVNDSVYSVPWMTMDTRICYYNIDMFLKSGWKVPKTFEEFETLLASIKASGVTPISLSSDPWCILFIYEPVLAACAPEFSSELQNNNVNITDQPARDALRTLLQWAKNDYFGSNWLSMVDSDVQNYTFATGKTAMTVAGSWDAVIISKNNPSLNFGVFAIPAHDGTSGLVGTAANGFSVNSHSKNLDAAIAFANFCAGEEAQTIWVQKLGAVPGTDKIEASTDIAKLIVENGDGRVFESWQNVLSHRSPSGEAFSIYEKDIRKVFLGEVSVDEFMDSISATITQ